MAKQKEAWDKLSMLEKALLIKLSVDNGVSSLKLIRDTYNLYADGGSKETSPIKDTSTKEYVVKKWPALGNIDFEVWKDPTFTREKTGAGSIEYFNAKYPGVTYLNGQYVANPSPGKDVIMYDPNTNDEQDVRLDALHIMPKDATYDALNALYRQAALNSDVSYNAKKNYERDKKLYGESNTDSYELYFNNEADGLLINMFIEGTPLYIESKRYYPNIQQLREWNTHLLPYIDEIHKYMETGLRPSYILPEITVTPNGVLYKNGGNLSHKKSGEELGETSWLNNGYNSSKDWLLLMKMQTNQMLQNLLNSPFYMTDLEMLNLELARMQEAMANNPSSEFITYTGFGNNGNEITKRLPVAKGLNTMMDAGVVDYMPMLGDAKQMAEAGAAALLGDYLTAGLLGGMMFLPNIIEKPLKKWKKVRNLTKELKERPLLQVVDDEEINAWLAENWYKNEIHNVRPKLEERSVDLMDFDRHGIPEHYTLDRDLPTHNRNKDNILIHVDNRTPLLVGRQGFLPIDANMGDAPAIWWLRDWPYYPAPTSLIPTSKFGNTPVTGHTLRVREGDVVPLDPHVRHPNAQGDIVVTEGVLPYDVLEGYKWNADLTWFEKERFAPSKSRWDYFKGDGLPGWSTFSTGGPLYPFSFVKNPFLKTPIVRY